MTEIEKWKVTPPDAIFNEIKEIGIKLWNEMAKDNVDGGEYLKEKLDRVVSLKNEGANWHYILQMFHPTVVGRILRSTSIPTALYLWNYHMKPQLEQINSP